MNIIQHLNERAQTEAAAREIAYDYSKEPRFVDTESASGSPTALYSSGQIIVSQDRQGNILIEDAYDGFNTITVKPHVFNEYLGGVS